MDYKNMFSPRLVTRMTSVHSVLREAMPTMSLDGWIKGFIGENRPENEIRIFEAIAIVYREVIAELDLTSEEKQSLYNTLVMVASGYVTEDIDERLPAGSPRYSELLERWEKAFTTNERL